MNLALVEEQMRRSAAEQGIDLEALLNLAATHFTAACLKNTLKPIDEIALEDIEALVEDDFREFGLRIV